MSASSAAAADAPASLAELCSPRVLTSLVGASVASCATEPLSGGLSGSLLRLRLQYDDAAAVAPATLVAKAHAPGREASSLALGLAREALFLASPLAQRPRSSLPPGALPVVYYARGDLASGRKALLLEDVAAGGGIQAGLFFGGGSPLNWNRPLAPEGAGVSAEEVSRLAFRLMARWHAAFWAEEALLAGAPWLRGAPWTQDAFEAAQAHAARAWASADAVIATCVPPRARAVVAASLARADWASFQLQQAARADARCWTLVHGDCHPANFVLRGSRSEHSEHCLAVLDFEAVGLGSGPQELSQFLISHMAPAARRACEESLLREYHEELLRAGCGRVALPWRACLEEYVAGGAERWVWLLAVLASMCPPDMVRFWAAQLDAFLEDHGVTADSVGMPRV
jgi:hypothetical protein